MENAETSFLFSGFFFYLTLPSSLIPSRSSVFPYSPSSSSPPRDEERMEEEDREGKNGIGDKGERETVKEE